MTGTAKMLDRRVEIISAQAYRMLRQQGLTDDEIDRAASGLWGGVAVADEMEIPTLAALLASLLMEVRRMQRRGVTGDAEVRAIEAEMSRISMRPNAEAGWKSKKAGTIGGGAAKRSKWAEYAACCVSRWENLPGHEAPLEYGGGDIYRDGDRIVFGGEGMPEKSLKRSTFEKRYLKRSGGQ